MSERIAPDLRQQVAERAEHCCEYCRSQVKFAVQSFAVEHIAPLSLGGRTMLDNLALACQGCNNHKYNKQIGIDPINNLPAPLFHPRQQQWREHFCWNDDFTLIIGLSPTGRATVGVLRLNWPGLVNLRRILYAAAEHLP